MLEELPHPRGITITFPIYLYIGNNTKTVFAAIYARYSAFHGRNQVSRFIPCHLRTVRTACFTGQTNRSIDNHVLIGVNQLNQKLHTPVNLTTDMILTTTRKACHLRQSSTSHTHICRDGYDMKRDVDDYDVDYVPCESWPISSLS